MKNSNNKNKFPGYPLYPAGEDIMNHDTRIEGEIEDLIEGNSQQDSAINQTNDELELRRQDDDELLKDRKSPVDFSGSDLDIPGTELDDIQEAVGSEDEENNFYSLDDNNFEEQI